MTIRRSINAAELSEQLGNLEECATMAPAGTYQDAKDLSGFFSDLFTHIQGELKAMGLKTPNGDQYREVEAVLYGMIKDYNPDSTTFSVSEGFGRAMNMGDAVANRVIANAKRDIEFLRSVGVVA